MNFPFLGFNSCSKKQLTLELSCLVCEESDLESKTDINIIKKIILTQRGYS